MRTPIALCWPWDLWREVILKIMVQGQKVEVTRKDLKNNLTETRTVSTVVNQNNSLWLLEKMHNHHLLRKNEIVIFWIQLLVNQSLLYNLCMCVIRLSALDLLMYQMLLITAATLWLNPSLVRSFHCPSTWNVQTLSLHLLHHHRQFWQNHYHFLGVNQLVMIPRVKMMRTVVLKTRTTLMIFSVHIQPGRI